MKDLNKSFPHQTRVSQQHRYLKRAEIKNDIFSEETYYVKKTFRT